MSLALLAIVVATGEASTSGSRALLAAASESLAPAASVRMLESPAPTDAEGLRIERELGASAVVILTWKESARLHALLRVHVASSNRWTARVLAFSPTDTLVQRGRTIGLAAASMCPQLSVPATASPIPPAPSEEATRPPASAGPPASPAPPPVPAERSVAPPADQTEPAREDAKPPRRLTADPIPVAVTAPSPTTVAASRLRLGAFAVATAAPDGAAPGLGGGVEGVVRMANSVGLRFGGSLRVGQIAALPGTLLVGSISGGVEWWPIARARWILAIRMDALLVRQQVMRTGAGQTESLGRFVPGADLGAVVALRVTTRAEIVVGLGVEATFGKTDVRDGSAHVVVANIPALCGVGQVGVRVGF